MTTGAKWVLAVSVLLTVAASAQAGRIASWENTMDHFGTGTNFDGAWFVTDIGVTHGNYALALDLKTGWSQGLRSSYVDGLSPDWDPFFPQLAGAHELQLDVTTNRTLFNNPGGTGSVQFALFMQGQPGGGASFNQTYEYQIITPTSYPGPDYQTETITWDLTMGGTVSPLPQFTEETGGWFDMRIHMNVSTTITDPGIIIIDNLRTYPAMDQPGNYTYDHVVNQADYTTWADHFNQAEWTINREGCNWDGVINTAEYTLWADHFGQEYWYGVPIPEPCAIAMISLGALALLRRRK